MRIQCEADWLQEMEDTNSVSKLREYTDVLVTSISRTEPLPPDSRSPISAGLAQAFRAHR